MGDVQAKCCNANKDAELKLEAAGENAAAVSAGDELTNVIKAESPVPEVADNPLKEGVAEDTDAAKEDAAKKVEEEDAAKAKAEEEAKAKEEENAAKAKVEEEAAQAETKPQAEAAEEANTKNEEEATTANVEEAAKAQDEIAKDKKKEHAAKEKEKADAAKKKGKSDKDVKKKSSEDQKKKPAKKKEEDAAPKEEKKKEEPKAEEAAPKEETGGAVPKEVIKAREAAWKKIPPAEQKEKAMKLLTAAKNGSIVQATTLIVEGGVSANCADGDGWTPLMKAAEANKIEMINFLFDQGAESGLAVKLGEWGNNALHHAARQNHTDAVRVLLARGKKSDTIAKNFQGKTPRDYATDADIKSMIKKASK